MKKNLSTTCLALIVSIVCHDAYCDEDLKNQLVPQIEKVRKAKQNEDQQAIDIIVKADRIRAPEKPFGYQLLLQEFRNNKQVNQQTLDISMRFFKPEADDSDFDARALIRFLSPAREKGKRLLSDFDKMWYFSPELRNPIPISKQQRLIGQVSNGDVVAADFDLSYIAKLIGEEACGAKTCYKLHLERRTPQVAYPAIIYLVEKDTYYPYQADFMSSSDVLIKRSYYKDYRQDLGQVRPHQIIVEDSLQKENYTIMNYSNLRYESLPESYFQKEYLMRMK